MWQTISYVLLIVVELAFMARAIVRPNREPASRIAWVAVIAAFPILGIVTYILFGETNIGRKRVARARKIIASLPPLAAPVPGDEANLRPEYPERMEPLFRLGESLSLLPPVGGNSAHLTADSNAAIDAMVADMDAAQEHIHLTFYIWLADNNGLKVVEALKRAAGRGVVCRAMADGLGSRAMIKSAHWKDMRDAGVKMGVALRIGNPLLRPLHGRVDLRNHRKIVVLDDWITYGGSQNCADPEFRVKPKFAPWVDALMRFEGPIARQNQTLFAADWMKSVDEDLRDLLKAPLRAPQAGFTAQVIATGPTGRASAMPEVFQSLMYAARKKLVITTPYYVPNEALQAALCAAANRGVETTIVFPARNDSWIVGAASRSYYRGLLLAGVKIHEYVGGLLHTKSMTIDDDVTLIGSANMDRRSFDLNYENNILFHDEALTAEMRERQEMYLASSNPVTIEDVDAWSVQQRLWNNTIAMLGPLL